MNRDRQDDIGRILWRDGQLLASRDLRGELQDDARRRRLHNRYLHATWGIAFGLSVTLDPAGGGTTVSPGYAVDVNGFDLILADAMRVAPPASDGEFILAATY